MNNQSHPELRHYIDSTMRTAFVACPQKFYREFICGLRPPGISIDLHAGGCFASAVEEVRTQVWKHGKKLDDALIIAQARFFQEWGDIEPPEWKVTAKTKDRVWEAVEAYFQHHSPLTDHVRPYIKPDGSPSLEYTFAVPLLPITGSLSEGGFPSHPDGAPFVYCGRFDSIGEYSGRPVVCDDKTTGSSIGRNWAYQWDLRGQFLGYVWACQENGIDLDTVVVRGIAIQKTQFSFAEAIKPYSNHLVSKWHEQLRRDMWRLRNSWDGGYWDYNLGDTCTAYGLCPFMTSCASPNPEAWLQEFEVRHWNPTKKNPTEPDVNGDQRTF